MAYLLKHTQRPGLILLLLIIFGGCATTPPRQPTMETVDRKEITSALRESRKPDLPGPPPFSQMIVPATSELDLPESLYSMTLNDVPLSAAIQAITRAPTSTCRLTRTSTCPDGLPSISSRPPLPKPWTWWSKNGAGYSWTVEGESLSIRTFIERIYAFDYLDMPSETDIQVGGDMLASSVEDAGVSGKYVMKTSKNKETSDAWSALEETLVTLKSEDGIVRINRNGGLIYIADRPGKVDAMVRFLDALSRRFPDRSISRPRSWRCG